MNYLSVCSGIEAASVAWHDLGWNPVAFSEIEKFPSAVLHHRFPNVPNLGDMTKYNEWPELDINLLVGGTPCQAFSVAGLREGLKDPRGNLTLTFLAIAAKYRPEYVCWENVPGVLSDRTNAFGQFLAGLAELGYGWAYAILDAQYFGVAQRRKRVFVVGCLGGWERAAEILFDEQSLCGDNPTRKKAGQDIAGTISSRTTGGGGLGTDFDLAGGCIPIQEPGKRTGRSTDDRGCGLGIGEAGDPCYTLQRGAVHGVATWPAEMAPTLNASFGDKQGLEDQHALNGGGYSSPAKCITTKLQRNDYETENFIVMDSPPKKLLAFNWNAQVDQMNFSPDTTPTLTRSQEPAVALGLQDDTTPKIHYEFIGAQRADAGGQGACVNHRLSVRRLTPVKCERLQGFPDNWTNIPWSIWKKCDAKGWSYEEELKKRGMVLRGPNLEECPDGPRYKAIGNSMAVPCMRWLGQRIKAVHEKYNHSEDWT